MTLKVHHYRQNKKKSTEQKIVENILKGLWWLISWPFKLIFGGNRSNYRNFNEGGLDRQFVDNKWREIDELIRLGKPSNNARAILEADKLLDHVLKGLRVPGLTMGDRLKAARKKFDPEVYDLAWQAHKVRNELVHNAEFEIMDYTARAAVEKYKSATNELLR